MPLVVALALTGCGSRPPAPEPPAATAAPEESAITTAVGDSTAGEAVTLTAADGLELEATFYAGRGEGPRPGVLFLHMLGSDRTAWQDVAGRFAEAGYSSLALDLRGHGQSGGAAQQDWSQALGDVLLAWQTLSVRPDVDGAQTAVVGASIGANLALFAAANEPRVDTAVLLSPGLDYQGVAAEEFMVALGDRPVLLVASNEDGYAADSARRLFELAAKPDSRLQLYDGAGHGTAMLGAEPELVDLILAWLDTHVSEGSPAGEVPQPPLPGN